MAYGRTTFAKTPEGKGTSHIRFEESVLISGKDLTGRCRRRHTGGPGYTDGTCSKKTHLARTRGPQRDRKRNNKSGSGRHRRNGDLRGQKEVQVPHGTHLTVLRCFGSVSRLLVGVSVGRVV